MFEWLKSGVTRIRERMGKPISHKAKVIIILSALLIIVAGSITAYKLYDYTQNNPKFCVTCHLMDTSYDSWATSEHKNINCHECHHLTIPNAIRLLYSATFKRTTAVPMRHKGDIVVAQQYCLKCHTEGKAKRIDKSPFHMRHVSVAKKECTECHGEVKQDKSGLHRFLPTEKLCVQCHEGMQIHHGQGMEALACLNCHTEKTQNLRPTREKCFFCHGADKKTRDQLIAEGTLDVRYFPPSPVLVKKARKIQFSGTSAMQFSCNDCHKLHTAGKVKPVQTDCLKCHADMNSKGKHGVHLAMNMSCNDCHHPHVWKVTDVSAKIDCVKGHELRSPKAFR